MDQHWLQRCLDRKAEMTAVGRTFAILEGSAGCSARDGRVWIRFAREYLVRQERIEVAKVENYILWMDTNGFTLADLDRAFIAAADRNS